VHASTCRRTLHMKVIVIIMTTARKCQLAGAFCFPLTPPPPPGPGSERLRRIIPWPSPGMANKGSGA
jgi:hypothetical protein